MLQPYANPRKGAERFIAVTVVLTEESIAFDPDRLDKVGNREFSKAVQGRDWQARKGVARIAWKSPNDRVACRDYQTGRRGNRWADVEASSRRMRAGELPPHGPVYLHASLTGRPENELVAIDGTRRLMAYLEAGFSEIDVVVLTAADAA